MPKLSPLPDSPEVARQKFRELRGIIQEVSGCKAGSGQTIQEDPANLGKFYIKGADGQWRPIGEGNE